MTTRWFSNGLLLLTFVYWGVYLANGTDVFVENNKNISLQFTSTPFQMNAQYAIRGSISSLFLFNASAEGYEVHFPSARVHSILVDVNRASVSFTFSTVSLTDSGEYYLSRLQDVQTLATLRLVVLSKPRINIITAVSSEPPIEERAYRIQCSATTMSKPDAHGLALSYSWKEGASPITASSDRYTITNNILEIRSVKREDGQLEFTCQASETGGDITVTSDDSPSYNIEPIVYISFDPMKDSYTFMENDILEAPIQVSCMAQCDRPCDYVWEILTDENGLWKTVNSSDIITVGPIIDRNIHGTYKCRATNNVYELSSKFLTVTVNYEPSIDEFNITPREAHEDQVVILSCMATGRPKSWVQISSSEGSNDLQEGKSNVSLTKVAKCEDTGQYTCVAWNYVGRDSRVDDLRVRCSPRVKELVKSDTLIIHTKLGENLTLNLPILAYPMPTVANWIHTQEYGDRITILKPRPLHRFSANTYQSTVVIYNVQRQDFGNYNIHMKNSAGEYNITVILEETAYGPEDENLDTGGIIGGTVAGVVAVSAVVLIAILVAKQRKIKKEILQVQKNKGTAEGYVEYEHADNLYDEPQNYQQLKNVTNQSTYDSVSAEYAGLDELEQTENVYDNFEQ